MKVLLITYIIPFLTISSLFSQRAWEKIEIGQSRDLTGITFHNGLFVIVGESGLVLTSTNLGDWQTKYTGILENFNDVIWADTQFVAVGNKGTLFTSPDGITWAPQSSGTNEALLSIAIGANMLIATGVDGTIISSIDGKAWTLEESTTSDTLYDITYANNTFITVGSDGTYLHSYNGSTWGNHWAGTSIYSIAYGDSGFIAMAEPGKLMASSSGLQWQSRGYGTRDRIFSLIYQSPYYVGVGENGSVMYSGLGTNRLENWMELIVGDSSHLWDVAYGDNKFVAVGSGGTVLLSHYDISLIKDLTFSRPYQFRVEHSNIYFNYSKHLNSSGIKINIRNSQGRLQPSPPYHIHGKTITIPVWNLHSGRHYISVEIDPIERINIPITVKN